MGPGVAPALSGPTRSAPPGSIHARLPPPAPTDSMSMTGIAIGKGSITASVVQVGSPFGSGEKSALVPPMWKVTKLREWLPRDRAAPAAASPARPLRTQPIDRRRRPCDVEVVQVRTVLAADDQQVFEARRRHEYRAGTFSLQDRVGGDRRPVGHVAGPELPHPVDHRPGGIGSGWKLGRHDLAAAEPDEVREGPADVHAHIHRRPDCPRPQETSRG